MARKDILMDLDGLVTKMAERKLANAKTAATKVASPGDGVDDHTKAPETGAQMASNKTEAAKGTKAMIDGGAEANKANESVANNTEGSTAVDPKGQSGTQGADLAVKNQAANGGDALKGDDKKTASAEDADLIAELEKAAASYDQPQTNEAKTGIPAAKPDTTKAIDAGKEKAVTGKVASAADPFGRFRDFLVAVDAVNLKTAADATAPNSPPTDAGAAGAPAADAGNGDQVIEKLLQAIQSGALTEEQAEQILNQAMKEGAIDPKMMAEAMDALHASGAPGDPAASATGTPAPAAPADAGAPAGGPTPAEVAPAAAPDLGGDPMAAAKVAAAEIGPEDPRYLAKLAALYAPEQEAGYAFGLKVAEELIKAANDGLPPQADGDKGEDKAPKADAPKDPMVDPAAAVQPHGEDEMAALKQLLDEMHIEPAQLAELLKQHHEATKAGAAPACDPAQDPAAAKVASFKKTARAAIVKMAVEVSLHQDAAAAAAAKK